MIYLLHGSDTVSSRLFLVKLKEKYEAVSTVVAKKGVKRVDLPDTEYLLSSNQLLILENHLPSRKPTLPGNADLVIWMDTTVEVPDWIDKDFPFKQEVSVNVFKLTDAVFYGQKKIALQILVKALAQNLPEEIIIGSLTRSVRQLSMALEGKYEMISKSSFVQKKVKEQAENWDYRALRTAAKLLLKADWEIKTGKIPSAVSLTTVVNNLTELAKFS